MKMCVLLLLPLLLLLLHESAAVFDVAHLFLQRVLTCTCAFCDVRLGTVPLFKAKLGLVSIDFITGKPLLLVTTISFHVTIKN